MDLEALRAQARAVASRMESRLTAALGANRELTAEEQTANAADEAELAELKGKITAAEAAATPPAPDAAPAPHAAAVAAERARIMGLVDLCPSSIVSTPLRAAIDGGVEPGAFAIDLARASKARGASVDDLKAGAVQPDQLPQGRAPQGKAPKAGTRERGQSIVARAAALGHSAVAHLAPKA